MAGDVYQAARRDADALLVYTIHAPIVDDKPLRNRLFQKLEDVLSGFPGEASKKLASTVYLNIFFERVGKILGGGFESFWFYISRTREELAPLFITYMLITYVLAFMSASYMANVAPDLALMSAIVFPTALVAVVFTGYLVYLYNSYRRWLSKAREIFAPIITEWKKEGRIMPSPAHPYEI